MAALKVSCGTCGAPLVLDGSTPELARDELGRLDRSEILRRARDAFAGWAAPVELFLDNTTRAMATPVYDVPYLPSWHEGRIVLIGDAAHAMSPAGGQGASLALEDALVLGRALSDSWLPVEDAFARFEEQIAIVGEAKSHLKNRRARRQLWCRSR